MDAETLMGADNKDVVKAWKEFNSALEKLEKGDYDKAVDKFKKAVENAEKALK